MGPIIYVIEGRSPSRQKNKKQVLHLSGALTEPFLEGSALFKGFGKLTQKRRFVFVTLLIWANVLMS